MHITHILRDRQPRNHNSATGLGAHRSHCPVALGGGSRKGAAGLVASQAQSHSHGCPSLALPEGSCVHMSLDPQQPPCLGVARASVGLVSGRRGWLRLSWGDVSPPLCRPRLLGKWRRHGSVRPRGDALSFGCSQSNCQAEEEGLWLATLEPPNCPPLSCLSSVSVEERTRGREGWAVALKGSLPASAFRPLPFPGAGRPWEASQSACWPGF